MSFLSDIVDFASNTWDWFRSDDLLPSLARTAVTAYAVNQVTKSINKANEAPIRAEREPLVDPGVRLQIDPDPENRVPVVYGRSYLGGLITDAVLTNNNQTMFFCITICEKTGVKFSDGQPSQFNFLDIYWEDNRIVFDSDGITVNSLVSRDGVIDTSVAGKIKVWCYRGSSSDPVSPAGYTNSGLQPAYSVMPNWTTSHVMSDLIFAIVRVDYNRDANITGLGAMTFYLENTMTQPGDCLFDLMTNSRYGAAIDSTEIYQS